jgi:hypothetical protein
MINHELQQLARRLSIAEHEIALAHAEIKALREQRTRRGQVGAIASGVVVVAAAVTASALWSTTTQAQTAARPLTVKAPFTVVDAGNKPILSVIADGHRGVYLSRSDGVPIVQFLDEYASIRGPLAVTDNADKPIVTVQDSTVTNVKDATGAEKPVTTNRGLGVLDAKGETVARVAVVDDVGGYVMVQDGPQKIGRAVMLMTKEGSQISMAGSTGKVTTDVSSKTGVTLYNVAGATVAEFGGGGVAGRMWLGNEGGKGVVEAGLLPDGLGVVRVGPRLGGPLGGLVLPFAIVGRR